MEIPGLHGVAKTNNALSVFSQSFFIVIYTVASLNWVLLSKLNVFVVAVNFTCNKKC